MTTPTDANPPPGIHFRRRKTTHTKRTRTDDIPVSTSHASTTSPPLDARTDAPQSAHDDEEAAQSLKEVLRKRKRPRDRVREVVKRPVDSETELGPQDAPREDRYTRRFVKQTGQVVDEGDAQMTVYIEARRAEQNHRTYGWPVPAHLQQAVDAMAPAEVAHTTTPSAEQEQGTTTAKATPTTTHRSAASHGALEEVPLPSPQPKPQNPHPPSPATAPKPPRQGGRNRNRNRRTSTDIQRDLAVEAILSESKPPSYFDSLPSTSHSKAPETEEDMLARFRSEYLEAVEGRGGRKPIQAGGGEGKGPKLGGSRSARAVMAAKEKEREKEKGGMGVGKR